MRKPFEALFVLHQNGQPLNVYDSEKRRRPELVPGPFGDPHGLANDLFETGEWDRVHVINKPHLREVARQAQTIENRALTLDAYHQRVFELMGRNPRGTVSVPPHPGYWHGWGYQPVRTLWRAGPGRPRWCWVSWKAPRPRLG